ncbi:cytochrome c biogenesis CcdA family protein [Ruminiclostridium cellobioparum]|uniref:Cytochrome c biogenesis protein n=1 Tax=Ruminiclostridium cellobioparum subsp. termitidis CT1112 TaxID=1195236 RepID=S0FY52_RUMCE|nr:cytochrome c biogenesis protein CcdA [Ruminiclostridium cellobioparum]EMS73513.1 Cytochrome c biogenesis protein [Ruminiclostridium cellobioparum subsp. termitidis CT1112]
MQYILLFLEGIITFISPCLLPMLPIYISYFAANEVNGRKTLMNAIGFVLGFTVVFITMGAFAGIIGRVIRDYTTILNVVTGLIVIVFGLNFLGVIKIGFLNRISNKNAVVKNLGFFSSMLFGLVFSISWTPCVGAFLGSALLMASLGGSSLQGISMLLTFSLGLGIPFVASALLIDQLKGAFNFIKRNYKIINFISGGLLIIIGILMATGYMGYFLSLLTF